MLVGSQLQYPDNKRVPATDYTKNKLYDKTQLN